MRKFLISFATTFVLLGIALVVYFALGNEEYLGLAENSAQLAIIDIEPPTHVELDIPTTAPMPPYESEPAPAPDEEPEPAPPQNQLPPDFNPPTYRIDNLIRQADGNVSLLFKNLETGFVHTYNADRVYFGASLNKLNHALYVFELAERGLIDLNHVHTFTEADIRGGTGQIQHMEPGTQFTTRELLRRSMVHSDNVAQHMLIRHTAGISFTYNDFVAQIGANPNFIGNIGAQNTNVHDKAIWMYAIHNYINGDGLHSHYFRAALLATPGFIMSDYPMARKYGWATASFHDAAIVYAPSPYILIILSDIDEGDATLFANLSLRVQAFNREWFE